MSNLIIFSTILIIISILFILSFKSYIINLIVRRYIKVSIRNNKAEIYQAKGNKQQQNEVYKRVYNGTLYRANSLTKYKKIHKLEQLVNNELNRMTNPFLSLLSSCFILIKGTISLFLLLSTVFFGSIVIDEIKASSLRLPTLNPDINFKLNISFEDRIKNITKFMSSNETGLQDFEFPQLSKEIVPIYHTKEYPSTIQNAEQLGMALAYHMGNFENQFTIYFTGDSSNFENTIDEAFVWLENNEIYLSRIRRETSSQYINWGNNIEYRVGMNYDLTAEQNALVNGKVKEIVKTMPKNLSEVEKVKYVNDYIVYHTKYNLESKASPYTPYSILINGEGVCEGYALTTLLLLKELGIGVKYISSETHAWNLVKVDGSWYHLDTTWNDPVPDQGKTIHYDYFLISDDQIKKDHIWDSNKFPKTPNSDYNFY